jgi:putative FmdB family regulatory protein
VPTYQYACRECGHAFEQVQSFSDDTLTDCPECEGRLRKVFNAVGVVFKGSGFYRNDSRKKDSSSETSASPAKADAAPAAATPATSSPSSSGDSGSSGSSTTATKSPQPTAS